MTSYFHAFFEAAVKPGPDRLASGFCVAAVNRDGSKSLTESYGTTTISGHEPFPKDPFAWIASMTKVVTAVATLQCVEKGLFSLDNPDDVTRLLPELSQLQVISDIAPGKDGVTFEPLDKAITLRMLLTHISGFGYDLVQPGLMAWRASRGEGQKWMCGNLKESYDTPLVAQPNTRWIYSPGFDWAGQMVERSTNMKLGDYFAKNIFAPLDIKSTLFDDHERPDLTKHLIPTVLRNEKGQLEDGVMPDHHKPSACQDHYGGAGLYSTPSDFLKFLSAILNQDEQLLCPESWSLILTGALEPHIKESLNAFLAIPFVRPVQASGLPDGLEYDFSICSLVIEKDVPGIAKAGATGWVSTGNQLWVVDPKAGYCGVMIQSLNPAGDLPNDELRRKVREYMYSVFADE